MAHLQLRITVNYEIDDKDMETSYGTKVATQAAEVDARAFQEDPGFIAEYIVEHAETTEIRVVVIP